MVATAESPTRSGPPAPWDGFIRIAFFLGIAGAGIAAPVVIGGARPWIVSILLFCVTLPLLPWAVGLLLNRASFPWIPWLHTPLVLLAAWFMVRYAVAPVEYSARYAAMTAFLGILALGVSAAWFDRGPSLTAFLWIWGVLGCGLAVYGLRQAWGGSNLVYWIERAEQYRGRASGSFINANHLAGWLELTAPWLIVVATQPGRRFLRRVPALAASVPMAIGHVFTLSRGGWLAAASQAGAFAWLRAPKGRARVLSLLALAILLGAAIGALLLFSDPVRDRFAESRVASDTSFRLRLHMWRTAWTLFLERPAAGIGPGMFEWAFIPFRGPGLQFWTPYAHNDYLQWMAEHGVFGTALLVLLIVGLGRVLLPARRADGRISAAGTAIRIVLAGVAVHSVFDFNLHIPANLLTLGIGLGFAVSDRSRVRLALPFWARSLVLIVVLAASGVVAVAAARTVAGAYYHERGRRLYIGFEDQSAVRALTRSVEWDRSQYWAWDLLGDALGRRAVWDLGVRDDPDARQRAFDAALEAHRAAAAANPFDPLHEQKQAGVYTSMGRLEESERIYRSLIERLPTDPSNHGLLGNLLLRQGRVDEAEQAYRKALVCHPGDELAVRQLNVIRDRREKGR